MRKIPIVQPMLGNDEIELVKEVISSGWLVEGKFARELERKFSEFTGIKETVTVANGTAALHLSLEALGIKPGDEVITTAFTFIASSNSILFVGGIPVFADVDIKTYNLDPDAVKKSITEKTKAILVVHLFGLPTDMKAIREIADEYGLYIIEDCAQAHGAKIDGKHIGNFGDIAAFSLYATKNMIAGEGGLVSTNNKELAEKVISLKNHGRGPEGGYKHYRVGYNLRMTDMQAAIALAQLKKLPKMLEIRHRNAKILREYVDEIDILEPQYVPDGFVHSNYIFAPHIINSHITPSEIISELKRHGISSRQIYSVPTYKQHAYTNIREWRWAACVKYPDYSSYNLKNTEVLCSSHFEIPVHAGVTEDEAVYIGETLKKIVSSEK